MPELWHGREAWSFHEDSALILTNRLVQPAPGAGRSLYITDIIVSLGAATAWNVLFRAGLDETILGPWYLEAINGRGAPIRFGTPKIVPANTALTVSTSAAVLHAIDVLGYIAPG